MNRKNLFLLLIALFIFRVIYGLCSEFWFPDELQIYLIGLKSFTTGTWPTYGPDVVYTNTQIPGALQGLLVSAGFYIAKLPEMPTLILNILSFASLSLLAYYITRRVKGIPAWMVWVLCMITPWALYYPTRVVNPSYTMALAIPFFICLLEVLPMSKDKFIPPGLAFFVMGLATTMIMQLHLSWVLLLPYAGVAMLFSYRLAGIKSTSVRVMVYLAGLIIGALTLIPTWLHPDPEAGKVGSNVVFNWENIKNIVTILTRYWSFASFEIPYVIGNSEEKWQLMKEQIWVTPFLFFLLIVGFAQVGLFILSYFIKTDNEEWKKMRWLNLFTFLLVFASFFFSIKGPSSHTFCMLLPLPMIYSFYCYEWLVSKKAFVMKLLQIIIISGIFFHIGLGIFNFQHRSLYKDRTKVVEALDKMDYKILGERRSDKLGYGY
ncbi:hypothetical protein [Chitinophaga filiformis]|uniref:4-amino-4-deoxy-L-arabinose transferase n=1 Tax=Chitinophaga filiformis TaxID=104663 RepID=A0A1G7TQ81_CHIFI|nr:hypothetical protein [Chitinophaga filiformis]SDG37493.1 hypothetical protein SAMN04488121_10442 [Chitinophaga filiformis]